MSGRRRMPVVFRTNDSNVAQNRMRSKTGLMTSVTTQCAESFGSVWWRECWRTVWSRRMPWSNETTGPFSFRVPCPTLWNGSMLAVSAANSPTLHVSMPVHHAAATPSVAAGTSDAWI